MALSTVRFLLIIYFTAQDLSNGALLETVSSCICPGYEAIFRCTVDGGVATTWRGSALENCSDGSITLRHSQFGNGTTINKTCGTTGQVIGQAISAENGSYTSQLTISNITQQTLITDNRVTCTMDGDGIQLEGTILSHPSNVQVSQISHHQLTVSWTPVNEDCPALHYSINATNCGRCPNFTYSHSVTCNITSLVLPQECSIVIQAVACNDVYGPTSEQLTVSLQVLDAPSFSVTPEYSGETKYLNKITVEIGANNQLQTVLNGNAVSYTINFTDTIFGIQCGSAFVPTSSSSCGGGVCTSTFTITSSSECHPSTDISVTVFATNGLGNGPSSDPTLINGMNDFIDIDLDFSARSTAKCRFLKQNKSAEKSCIVYYGFPKQRTQCNGVLPLSSNATATSDIVSVNLQPPSNQDSVYCYRLIASDGIHTVAVAGMLVECNPNQLSDGMSIPNSNVCRNFHSALGIENGIICFSGTKVGSTAIYYCNDCGYKELVRSAQSLIRSCQHNGQWNGSIPNCKCASIIGSNPELLYGVFGGAAVVTILVITTCFTIAIITLLRAKAKLQVKLEQAEGTENGIIIYEEIKQVPPSNMDTTDNVAYATCQAFTCKST